MLFTVQARELHREGQCQEGGDRREGERWNEREEEVSRSVYIERGGYVLKTLKSLCQYVLNVSVQYSVK